MSDVGERVIQPGGRVEAQIDVVAGDAILPLPVKRIVRRHAHVGGELALDARIPRVLRRRLQVRRQRQERAVDRERRVRRVEHVREGIAARVCRPRIVEARAGRQVDGETKRRDR